MKHADRYSPLLVTLHWALAIAIIGSLVYGFTLLGRTPNLDTAKVELLRPHMALGMAVGMLTLLRLLIRLLTQRPQPAASSSALELRLAAFVHAGLYLFVLGMVASGFVTALEAGLPDIVFGRSGAPLPADFKRVAAKIAHTWIGVGLVALIAIHGGAALHHHVVRRDHQLRRMWFARSGAPSDDDRARKG